MSVSPKRLTAARLAGVPELELAFTDWTDTYDIHDGGGVRPPDKGAHVKLLQESLLAMGYDLSPLGANGIYGSETTAAVMQFQIDAGHPRAAGHEWEHIGGMAGPNTMAHFDMFDPGGTVGNWTSVPTGVPAIAVTFSESVDNPLAGFDATTSAPELMVGTTTRRRVRVELEPDNSDVSFNVADPAIASVGLTAEGIVVGGERAGRTTVRATSNGEVLAELAVTVKDVREETVNVFFVSDASSPKRSTARPLEQAVLLTLRLNRLWRRQANVHFTLNQARDVVVEADLGDVVGPDADHHFLSLAPTGEFSVFCIWDCEPGSRRRSSLFLLPDHDCSDGMVVPHAAGHYLGFDQAHPSSGLMSPCLGGIDRERISNRIANIVNP